MQRKSIGFHDVPIAQPVRDTEIAGSCPFVLRKPLMGCRIDGQPTPVGEILAESLRPRIWRRMMRFSESGALSVHL